MSFRQYFDPFEDHIFGEGESVLFVDDLGQFQVDTDHLGIPKIDVDEVDQVGDLAYETPGVGAARFEYVWVVPEPVVQDFDALEGALLGDDLQHVVDVHHLHFLDDAFFGLAAVGNGFRRRTDAVPEAVQLRFLWNSAVRFVRNL